MKFTAAQYASILYALATTPLSATSLPTDSASSLRSRNNDGAYMSGLTSDKWTQALAKAQAAVAQMTLAEKVSSRFGSQDFAATYLRAFSFFLGQHDKERRQRRMFR